MRIKIKTISLLSIVILLLISCASQKEMTKRNLQKEVYKVVEHFSISEIERKKMDKLWVNAMTEKKVGLGLFKIKPGLHFGKMPIELQIKDSVFRKQILTKENIDFFKEQLTNNEYNLVSKKLSNNPKIGIIPKGARYPFWVKIGKDSRQISKIMFTKDGKYALFYVSVFEGTIALWVYKNDNNGWKYHKAFHAGIQ